MNKNSQILTACQAPFLLSQRLSIAMRREKEKTSACTRTVGSKPKISIQQNAKHYRRY